jgi:hypothetical protein
VCSSDLEVRDRLKQLGARWDGDKRQWMVPDDKLEQAHRITGYKGQPPRSPAAETAPAPMTPARKEAIHEALRHLAGNDTDRARERNAVGFNQMDSDFGGQLANQDSLSDRQAEAAARMLHKYRGQLGDELHKRVSTAAPAQHSRVALARQYARLSARAQRDGDRASAMIYARAAREAGGE